MNRFWIFSISNLKLLILLDLLFVLLLLDLIIALLFSTKFGSLEGWQGIAE